MILLQDYRSNSEKAKRELDGKVLKGRTLRVRSAPHSAAIRVKNLSPFVTNELLERAFSIFGDVSLIDFHLPIGIADEYERECLVIFAD